MNKMLTEWQKIKEYGEKINEKTRAKIKMSNNFFSIYRRKSIK